MNVAQHILTEVDRRCANNAILIIEIAERSLYKKAVKGQFGCEEYKTALAKYVKVRIKEKRLRTDIKRGGHTDTKAKDWMLLVEKAKELKKIKDSFL